MNPDCPLIDRTWQVNKKNILKIKMKRSQSTCVTFSIQICCVFDRKKINVRRVNLARLLSAANVAFL